MRLGRCSRRVLRAFCVLAEPVCRVYFLCPVGVPCVRRVGNALEQQAAAARAALPYPQRAEAQAALDALEASRTALRTGMERAQHSLKQAEQAYAAAQAAVDALQAQALAAVLMEETP